MFIITGAAGFIGSNIIKGLNDLGENSVLAVDDLTDGTRFLNMVDCELSDYQDQNKFLKDILDGKYKNKNIKAVFHLGACSSTTEWNGKFMMENNYEYSKALLHFCLDAKIPFIYASSAAVYGNGKTFVEKPEFESPLNVYGYSKFLFDQYVRKNVKENNSQVVGLRYFNVYGPREQHKGTMSSVAFHFNNQIKKDGKVSLFEGTDGYGPGEQRRDFIYVKDAVKVNIWFYDNPQHSGIYNLGTGRSQSFNDVANAVIKWHKTGHINYIPFPEHLKGRYQSFTEADLSALRNIGYDAEFYTVEEGVKDYLDWLNRSEVEEKALA